MATKPKPGEVLVPEKLTSFYTAMCAYDRLRDACIKIPFRYKKAVEAALKSEDARMRFWSGMQRLYPQMRRGTWRANGVTAWQEEEEE